MIEANDGERFERAAVRWAGRLALETPDLALAELAGALESLHALPDEHAQRARAAIRLQRGLPDRAPRDAAASSRPSRRRGHGAPAVYS